MTNIIRPPFGSKSQIGDSKKKTSEIKSKSHSQRAEFKDINANGDVNLTVNQTIIDAGKSKTENEPPLIAPEFRITKEHRDEINYLVNEFVDLYMIINKSATQKSARQMIYPQLKRQAQSVGNYANIELKYFPECDFEIAKHYVQLRIRILRNNESVWKESKNWRNDRLNAIHARCKNMEISDERRKIYQLARFGKESLRDFTNQELQQMFVYTFSENPSFNPDFIRNKSNESSDNREPETDKKQIQRERVLSDWLNELQANDPTTDINNLPYTQEDMLKELQAKSDLFDLATTSFATFWKTQKLCKLKPKKTKASK